MMSGGDVPVRDSPESGPVVVHLSRDALDESPRLGLLGRLARSDVDLLGHGPALVDGRGSLVAGKRADFLVLSGDPLEGPTDAIKDVKVLQTWVQGVPILVRP